MQIRLSYITTLLAVGVAATAIAASPTAMADPAAVAQSCIYLGVSETQCQTPGNVQINDNPAYGQGTAQYPYWESDSFRRRHR